MDQIGFFVELDIDPAQLEDFDKNMLAHSKATLSGEEGCLAFDVYVERSNPNRYALFELYADEQAIETHRFSNQLAKHRTEVDPAILRRKILRIGVEVDESEFRGTEA
ncbi:MAG: antibiotic biosynthesis monooxygenase [Acidimicrobiia bacterium]